MLNMVILPIVPEFFKNLNNGTHYPVEFINKFLNINHSSVNSTQFDLKDENSKFNYNTNDILEGCLYATKPLMQLLINPFSGALIDRIG